MGLADSSIFSKDHIEKNAFAASAVLAEQAVHCLELVAELTDAGLSFQFKGGNSLLLILDQPKRFSIDVDIATDEPRERIESRLDALVKRHTVFVRWTKRQHKTKPWLPIASYHLYYRSVFEQKEEPFIMLDAQLRRSPYRTHKRTAQCGRLYTCGVDVEIPLTSSIIGDKLLAVGPNTLGIPVGKGKDAQRLKHVFDISTLLEKDPDLDVIRESFHACMKHENEIQEKKITADAVMKDTIRFCGTVAHFDLKPDVSDKFPVELRENITGLQPFSQHLFETGYGWERMQTDMARVAACITAVCRPAVESARFAGVFNREEPGFDANADFPDYLMRNNGVARRYWKVVAAWLGGRPDISIG